MGISRDNRTKRRATGGKKKHFRKSRKLERGRQPTLTKIGERKTALVRRRGGSYKTRALRLDAGNFGWGTEGIARKARILGVSYNATSNELVRTNTLVKNSIIQIDATPFRQWYELHYGVNLGRARKAAEGGHKEPSKEDRAKALLKNAKASSNQKKVDAAKAKGPKEPEAGKEPTEGGKKATGKAKISKKTGKPFIRRKHDEHGHRIHHKRKVAAEDKPAKKAKTEDKPAKKAKKVKKPKVKLDKDGKPFEKKPKKKVSPSVRRKEKNLKNRIAPVEQHIVDQFLTGRLYAAIASRPGQDGVADGYILEGRELDFYLKKMQKKKSAK